ncbi:hypothetical protein CHS0354_030697 [Potamilus streckersoni]|uniref:Uncharacterized protein n=1 Tax=Potamilus streckersoni TaxID=2493646 RepID=A0AAE0VRH0_9BIVA|nr:hypothetical protein CHS0354_030697 [Potamilus streckersoni]
MNQSSTTSALNCKLSDTRNNPDVVFLTASMHCGEKEKNHDEGSCRLMKDTCPAYHKIHILPTEDTSFAKGSYILFNGTYWMLLMDIPTLPNRRYMLLMDIPTLPNRRYMLLMDIPTLPNRRYMLLMDIPTLPNRRYMLLMDIPTLPNRRYISSTP